jgi:hypothetical protein
MHISYHIISYHIISYHIISYHYSYHIVSCTLYLLSSIELTSKLKIRDGYKQSPAPLTHTKISNNLYPAACKIPLPPRCPSPFYAMALRGCSSRERSPTAAAARASSQDKLAALRRALIGYGRGLPGSVLRLWMIIVPFCAKYTATGI